MNPIFYFIIGICITEFVLVVIMLSILNKR